MFMEPKSMGLVADLETHEGMYNQLFRLLVSIASVRVHCWACIRHNARNCCNWQRRPYVTLADIPVVHPCFLFVEWIPDTDIPILQCFF